MSKKMIMLLVGLVAVIAVYSFYTKEAPQAENKMVDSVANDSTDQATQTQEVIVGVVEETMPANDVPPKDMVPSDASAKDVTPAADVPQKEMMPGEASAPTKEMTPDNINK